MPVPRRGRCVDAIEENIPYCPSYFRCRSTINFEEAEMATFSVLERVSALPAELREIIFSYLPPNVQTLCVKGHILITQDRTVTLPCPVRVFLVGGGGGVRYPAAQLTHVTDCFVEGRRLGQSDRWTPRAAETGRQAHQSRHRPWRGFLRRRRRDGCERWTEHTDS